MSFQKCTYVMVVCSLMLMLAGATIAQQVDYGIHAPDYSRVARSGWQFLKLPTNARYAALGGIVTSIANGEAASALGNPASITDVDNLGISVSNMNYLADISYQSGSVVKNFDEWGTFGVNVIYLDYGDMIRTENIEQFDADGNSLGRTRPDLSAGTVTGGDFGIGLNYARRVTNKLQIGGTIRLVQEDLDGAKTTNWTIDVGTVYYTGIKTLRIAMLGRNFGPDAEFVDYKERIGIPAMKVPTPMMFQLGAAIDILEGRDDNPHLWTVAAEFTHPNDGPEKVHLGSEYTFMDFAMLRAGYKFNYDEEGLTLGGGVRIHNGAYGVLIDYAYVQFGRLGQVHMFSVGFSM